VSFLLGPVVSIFTYLLIVLKVQNMPVPEVLSSALSAGLQPNKGRLNLDDQYSLFMYEIAKLTLWRPLLPYEYSYKASCVRLG